MDNCKQNVIDFLPYISRREELLANHEIPLQSEMASQLGEPLAHAVSSTMTDVGKILMGTFDNLKGPPNDLWISPSDQLIGKVRLTSPYSNKILKALTHQTIIELGIQTEEKIKNEMEKIIEKVKEETSNFEKFKCCKHIKHAVEKERKEQEYIRKIFREDLIKKYEQKLEKKKQCYDESNALLTKFVIKKCDIETQKVIQEDRKMVEEYVRNELTKCYEEKVAKMKNDFTMGILHAIEHQKTIDYEDLKEMHHDYKLEMRAQLNQMKCGHIVDLMHLLCAEKAKYNQKQYEAKISCKQEINELSSKLDQLLNSSPEIKECPNIKIWHDKCAQILQNYDNFVDRQVSDIPGQGAYLTQIHKMLETQMAESHHPDNNYQCYNITGTPVQLNVPIDKNKHQRSKNKSHSVDHKNKIIPKQNNNKKYNDKGPFKIYFDNFKEEVISEHSDSLDSIEFDGKIYVNVNKFLEKDIEIPSDPDINITKEEAISESEYSILSDDSLFMIDYIDEAEKKKIDIENLTRKLKTKINTDVISSAIVNEIKKNVENNKDIIENIESIISTQMHDMINIEEVKSLIENDQGESKTKRKSKLLATTDSLEIYKEKFAGHAKQELQEQDLFLETTDSIDIVHSKLSELVHNEQNNEMEKNKNTMERYLQSFKKVPPYLFTSLRPDKAIRLKDNVYKTTSDQEIFNLLQKFKDRETVVKSVASIVSVDTTKVHLNVGDDNSKKLRKDSILKTRNSNEDRNLTFKKSKSDRSVRLTNQLKLRSLIELLEDDKEISNLLRKNLK